MLIIEDGQVNGIYPQAFELRPKEQYLSAAWLEHFDGTQRERIDAIAKATARTRNVKVGHAFAIGNVGRVKDACSEYGLTVRIIHQPSASNPAYTAVRQYKSDRSHLLEFLAAEAWSDLEMVLTKP